MIITLELTSEMEAKLREDAAKHDAEAVRRLLVEAVAPVIDATVDAILGDPSYSAVHRADGLTDQEFEALVDELVNMPPALPTVPADAMGREGIY
jgi:hypothetical protein